ncbi:hypothetical protein pb186bvf_009199 [Paramecium bursaria]
MQIQHLNQIEQCQDFFYIYIFFDLLNKNILKSFCYSQNIRILFQNYFNFSILLQNSIFILHLACD